MIRSDGTAAEGDRAEVVSFRSDAAVVTACPGVVSAAETGGGGATVVEVTTTGRAPASVGVETLRCHMKAAPPTSTAPTINART